MYFPPSLTQREYLLTARMTREGTKTFIQAFTALQTLTIGLSDNHDQDTDERLLRLTRILTEVFQNQHDRDGLTRVPVVRLYR